MLLLGMVIFVADLQLPLLCCLVCRLGAAHRMLALHELVLLLVVALQCVGQQITLSLHGS